MLSRREFAALSLAAPAAFAKRFDRGRIAVLTDEVSKTSPDDAIAFCKQYGVKLVELRGIPGGKGEYAFLPEPDVKLAAAAFRNAGLKVSFLNSSLLKFTWPGTEQARRRPETPEQRAKRIETESRRFDQRTEMLKRAIANAHLLGVDKIRVFTGMRVAEPEKLMPRIADVIGELALIAEKEKVQLLVENEGACNVATCAELATLMKLVPSKAVGINWDPQNGFSHKEIPYPDGYRTLPFKRLGNVQVKGKGLLDPEQKLDWQAIMAGLHKDGYTGNIGLETHYFDGTLIEKSHICIKELLRMADQV